MNNNSTYKEQLFMHMDGIAIIPTLSALNKIGVLDYINKKESFNLDDIINNYKLSTGYLNIALRNLLSIGILEINNNEKFIDVKEYNINYNELKNIREIINNYDFIKLISIHMRFKDLLMSKSYLTKEEYNTIYHIIKNINNLKDRKSNSHNRIYYYIEGILLGPILSNLGFLDITFKEIENKEIYELVTNIFQLSQLINNKLELTEKGLFFHSRSSSYGVTTSYLPLFNKLTQLISQKNNLVWERDNRGYELHVNRSMNVWGSGGSHKFYFKKIDNIIIDIFNNHNIDNQPKGIIDIGCGDGTFLKHCYEIIINKTLRGKNIKKYPLKLIGVDLNKAARIATRSTLNKNHIDNIVINGNISDPDGLNKTLEKTYNEKLNNFISTRTFLDHNRSYIKPKEIRKNNIKTTGAFCYKGKMITNSNIINNLIEHFMNWKRYINKHGLIILELHTIHPNLIRANTGKTLACAYDTTHGFSDQYLIEYESFIQCANYAGMNLEEKSVLFPNEAIPTISINYFK